MAVSIHAPVKGAILPPFFELQARLVSIHAPVKGAIDDERVRRRGYHVSIHAPVKGAMGSNAHCFGDAGVSIHAPVKGAIRTTCPPRLSNSGFNPRTREGCDRKSGNVERVLDKFQSTHP